MNDLVGGTRKHDLRRIFVDPLQDGSWRVPPTATQANKVDCMLAMLHAVGTTDQWPVRLENGCWPWKRDDLATRMVQRTDLPRNDYCIELGSARTPLVGFSSFSGLLALQVDWAPRLHRISKSAEHIES